MLSSFGGIVARVQRGGLQELRNVLGALQFRYAPGQRRRLLSALGRLVARGKALDVSIGILHKRYQATGRPLAGMFGEWHRGLRTGLPFSQVIRGYFPEMEAIVIGAGERSGSLARLTDDGTVVGALAEAAEIAGSSEKMMSTLAKASAQPAMYIVALFGIAIMFSTGPGLSMQKSVPEWALDERQRSVFAVANVVGAYWPLIVGGALGAFALTFWSLPRLTGPLRTRYLDRIPPWSIYKSVTSAATMIAVAALIKAGLPLGEAVRYVRVHASPWLDVHLQAIQRRLNEATTEGEALDVGLVDQDVADYIAIDAETGSLDQSMSSLSKEALLAAVESVERQAGFVKIVVIAMVGAVIFYAMDTLTSMGDAQQRAMKGNPKAHVIRK